MQTGVGQLTNVRVFVAGIGIISPLGIGYEETKNSLRTGKSGIKSLSVFSVPHGEPLPSGEISFEYSANVPRTHALALIAAKEAVKDARSSPDAIVLGSTTGGMPLTENLIKEKKFDPVLYKYHSTGSVAEYIAEQINCRGIVLTVSTACSSGALAVKLALEMLRTGTVKSVLAGGADALCRLTYHGFNSLQLIDPNGPHPLDKDRKGMAVAEGAAMLLLSAYDEPPQGAIVEILGAGLSCDAYHPASPHPEGRGAADAIRRALADAGVSAGDIDYVNLHGTGTIDNDLAEARALREVFRDRMPYLSSIKGASGHSLAASGAIEAAVSAISITERIIPSNTGCTVPDPALGIEPVKGVKTDAEINTVLSNSFGFGGNNAVIVIGKAGRRSAPGRSKRKALSVLAKACVTGAGDFSGTIGELGQSGKCSGLVDIDRVSEILPKSKIRRLKRLPRMVLALSEACKAGMDKKPSSVFFGTGWGSLSETYEFLEKLFESGEQFPSPTDFIGSVHNAPAGQAAIWHNATGANVTATGGDYSFEQALFSASLLAGDSEEAVLIIGADEYHNVLTRVLDGSAGFSRPSDGGGAFLVKSSVEDSGLRMFPSFFGYSCNNNEIIKSLVKNLGDVERIKKSFGAVFAGIPACERETAVKQLSEFKGMFVQKIPVIDYRKFTGEYASASAVAAAIALECAQNGRVPHFGSAQEIALCGKGILIVGLGRFVTAIEILN